MTKKGRSITKIALLFLTFMFVLAGTLFTQKNKEEVHASENAYSCFTDATDGPLWSPSQPETINTRDSIVFNADELWIFVCKNEQLNDTKDNMIYKNFEGNGAYTFDADRNYKVLIDDKTTKVSGKDYTGQYLVSLYAILNVTFDLNNGTGDAPTDTNDYIVGDTLTFPGCTGFSREYYAFVGWSTNKNATVGETGEHTFAISDIPETGNTITYYAIWQDLRYQEDVDLLIHDFEGFKKGTTISEMHASIAAGSSEIEIVETSMYQYETLTSSKVKKTSVDAVGYYDVVYVIKGKTTEYIFPNEGNSYVGSVTLNDESASATGYYNANPSSYILGSDYSNEKYLLVVYTYFVDSGLVTYDANTTDTTVSNMPTDTNKYFIGDAVTVSSKVPTRKGYTFDGWKLSGASTTVGSTVTMVTGGVTLYACWSPILHSCDNGKFGIPLNSSFTGGTLAPGNYYLVDYIYLTSAILTDCEGTVNICLNDYSISTGQNYFAFNVLNGTLNIYDCGTTVRYLQDRDGDGIFETPRGVSYKESNPTEKFVEYVGGRISADPLGDSIPTIVCSSGATLNIVGVDFAANINYSKAPSGINGYGGVIYNNGSMSIIDCNFASNCSNNGGAIANFGSLIIKGSTFSDNFAYNIAGVIYNNGYMELYKSSFEYNTSKMSGGAVYSEYNPSRTVTLNITDSSFSHNKTTDTVGYAEGGAIFANVSTKTFINNSTFEYNESFAGGAVCNKGTLETTGGSYKNNSAKYSSSHLLTGLGGAIFVDGSLTVNSGTFENNTAEISGGAIYNYDSDETLIKGGTYSENTAPFGGAIGNASKMKISGGTFLANIAYSSANGTRTGSGGAVYNYGGDFCGSSLTISGGIFAYNESDNYGGAISNYYGTLVITAGNFTFNETDGLGGAIYGIENISISNASFEFNSAALGGAIYAEVLDEDEEETTLVMNNPSFRSNEAESNTSLTESANGGAIYVAEYVKFTMNDGSFNSNSATYGGAIYINSDSTINDGIFYGNSAKNGGAIYVKDCQVLVNRSDFEKNSASYGGGAVYALYASTKVIDKYTKVTLTDIEATENEAATAGGFICVYAAEAVIKGGTIQGCTAKSGGAIYSKGIVTISDNGTKHTTIKTCVANYGGAIVNRHILTINYAIITKNKAGETSGGAIYSTSTFTFNDGLITENTSKEDGSGIYSTGELILLGGTISKNTITDETYGYGVYVINDNHNIGYSTLELGGTIVIEGSASLKDSNPLYIVNNIPRVTFSSTTPLATGASIAIITENETPFATGASTSDYSQYFIPASTEHTYYVHTVEVKDTTTTYNYSIEQKYKVSYIKNTTETVTGLPTNAYYFASDVVTLSSPSRVGFNFSGWSLTSDGDTIGASYTVGTSDVDLYAIWNEKTVVITSETQQEYVYTGSSIGFEIINNNASTFTVKYYVSGSWTETVPTSAGSYNVQLTRAEDDKYKAYSKEIENGLVISKATPIITLETNYVEYTFGETWTLPTSSSTFGTASPDKQVSEMANAGTYTLTYTVEGTSNYESASEEITVKINKLKVSEPTVSGTYTYNGETQTVTIEGVESFMSTTDVLTGINAQSYTITYTLDSNHEWNSESDGVVTWSISKAKAVITVDQTPIIKTYGETVTLPVASTTFGTVTKNYESIVNVGSYTLTYSVEGTQNYDGDSKSVSVTISKLKVSEPTISGSYTYTGSPLNVVVTGKENYMTTSSSLTETNVGEYTITYTLDSNHEWAEGSDGVITWVISKGQAVITVDQTPIVKTYGETITLPTATSTLGTVTQDVSSIVNAGDYTVTYTVESTSNYDGDTKQVSVKVNKLKVNEPTISGSYQYTGSPLNVVVAGKESYMSTTSSLTETNAGEYVISYTLDSNHEWSEGSDGTVIWMISKAQATITVDQTTIIKTYNETVALPTATSTFGNPQCDTEVTNLVNAGTYTVTYFVNGTTNYFGDTKTLTVIINKAQAVITVDQTPIVITYGETITLPTATSTFGTPKANKQVSEMVDAGVYTVTYKVDETSNYLGDQKNISVTINKIKVAEPTTTSVFTYDGTPKTATVTGVKSYMSTESVLTHTEPGLYRIEYTLDPNYEWDESSDGIITWEIKSTSISSIEEGETSTKPSVVVEMEGGFASDINVVVEITKESEVQSSIDSNKLTIDYYNIKDKEHELSDYEVVSVIYDIKLIQIVNGERTEIQPSDIKEGAVLTVKILIPEEIDITKIVKILHVHSKDDIEEIAFDASKVDEDRYFEIQVDRFSEFAFVCQNECENEKNILILLGSFLLSVLILWFIFKARSFRGFKAILPILVFIAEAIAILYFSLNADSVKCLALLGINAFTLITFVIIYIANSKRV